MISVPEMVMIGGNSRNSGKTTLACSIIRKLSVNHEVIGLKVTSVKPGEDELHGNHNEDFNGNFTIFEEKNSESHKDTAKMLQAGAAHVYYIRVEENFTKQAIIHFLLSYAKGQLIVCESRSLRSIVNPGLFLIMMRLQVDTKTKDMSEFLGMADKILYFEEGLVEIKQFSDNLKFNNRKFVWNR
ncbi:MAG: hypothetical protein Q7U54_18025 [Bacteroidales bacterium]|nr:hypothetical protein [Bacteroidales bacterium]